MKQTFRALGMGLTQDYVTSLRLPLIIKACSNVHIFNDAKKIYNEKLI